MWGRAIVAAAVIALLAGSVVARNSGSGWSGFHTVSHNYSQPPPKQDRPLTESQVGAVVGEVDIKFRNQRMIILKYPLGAGELAKKLALEYCGGLGVVPGVWTNIQDFGKKAVHKRETCAGTCRSVYHCEDPQ